MTLRASVALLGLSVFTCGCAVKPPGKAETGLAASLKHRFVGGKKEQSPLTASLENRAAGQEAFSHYCVACHGLDGQNTGVPFANSMSPPVPSLASSEVQTYTDGQLKSIIKNGIYPSGMPASKDILNEDEIWAIVLYIRHLPIAGSLGEPCMYSGEDGDCKPHDNQVER